MVLDKVWDVAGGIPPEVQDELKAYPPILRQMLFNRQIRTSNAADQYLNAAGSLHNPFLLGGMEAAVRRILYALDHDENIAVYGDYDVDGVTATALLVQALRKIGRDHNGRIREYIPNRFVEGYGLNEEALRELSQDGFHLVITVDCGIRSPREVALANSLGVDTIISDHHGPLGELPEAAAIICQKLAGDAYPDKDLAGVGLAFKIVEALLDTRPVWGLSAVQWLDLVAVGSVADLVPLVGENRAMVKAGLNLLRRTSRPGMIALAKVAGVQLDRINARDIGFAIGPRLNAAGRLDTAIQAYNLLMAEDKSSAEELAVKLNDQNRERQDLTRQMVEQVEKSATISPSDDLIFAVDSGFNMGIVGLVASRLVENYYRPAVVGARGEEFTRASCRSIPEFHITRALDECADLLVRHGGHKSAAGFTVRNDQLPLLEERLRKIAAEKLGSLQLRPQMRADLAIKLDQLRPALLGELELLEPTGMDNPEAVFASYHVGVDRMRAVGEGKHLRLRLRSDKNIIHDGIAFRMGDLESTNLVRANILYCYELNSYTDDRGRLHEDLQLRIRDIKPG